jgi:photosystem II stability/assembly factor-like uncharacterized protein
MLVGCAIRLDTPSPSEAPLTVDGSTIVVRSLECLPTGEVIAAGDKDVLTDGAGVVFLSEDRGETWRRVPLHAPGVSLSLLVLPGDPQGAVYASGYRTGTTVLSSATTGHYEPGPWWVTRDKGRSWQESEPRLPLVPTADISARLPAIVRADHAATLIGVVDGQSNLVVLRSSDGGRAWTRQDLPKLGHYGSLVSNGRGRVVVTGRADVVQRTTPTARRIVRYLSNDAGATWRESGVSSDADLVGALRLYLTPSGALLTWANDELRRGYPAMVSRSFDGGRNWEPAQTFPGTGRILGIAGDARGRVIAMTSRGAVLRSTDDGASWRVVHSSPLRSESSAIVFSDGDAILITGDRGRFMRSLDGGETWHAVDSALPDRQYVLDAHCTDGRGLVVVGGSGGMVTRSTDWGANWHRGTLITQNP